MLKRTAVQSSPEHFRPYFVIDEHMRVQVWPDATARALGISEGQAKGRPCWELLGASAHCQVCRDEAVEHAPLANRCARLPLTVNGAVGWRGRRRR